jgi:hypothetical protein
MGVAVVPWAPKMGRNFTFKMLSLEQNFEFGAPKMDKSPGVEF